MISNIYFLGKDREKSRKRRGKEIVNVRFDLCFGMILFHKIYLTFVFCKETEKR